jgi:hypothetical protein
MSKNAETALLWNAIYNKIFCVSGKDIHSYLQEQEIRCVTIPKFTRKVAVVPGKGDKGIKGEEEIVVLPTTVFLWRLMRPQYRVLYFVKGVEEARDMN